MADVAVLSIPGWLAGLPLSPLAMVATPLSFANERRPEVFSAEDADVVDAA